MDNFVTKFSLDPAPSVAQFLQSLNRLMTGPELQQLRIHDGVATSVVHHTDGRLDVILGYRASGEQGEQWRTTATITRDDSRALVRVEVYSLDSSVSVFQPRKSPIIEILLDCFGCAGEHPFKASRTAFIVNNNRSNFAHIKQLVACNSQAECPVIYVTKAFLASKTLEPDELAQRLYGIAYILIERDKYIGKKLNNWLQGQNIKPELCPGSASLFWPKISGLEQHILRLDKIEASGDAFLDYLEKQVLSAGISGMPSNETVWLEANQELWDGVKAEKQIDRSKKYGQTDAIAAEKKNTTIRNNNADHSEHPELIPLQRGKQQDAVKDEALEMVLDAIDNYVKTKLVSDPNSGFEPCRRIDVLQAVLDANPLPDPQVASNQERAHRILSGTRGINLKTETALQKIGIRIKRGGKHPKLTFGEDDRYVLTAASSSSDRNGWINLVTDIKRKFF